MELNGRAVYFPFPDGAWGYDCVRCGSVCCKGNGFGASPDEYARLQKRYPRLKVFARFGDAPTVALINFKGGCHFLEDSGLCRIHQDLGREAKPFVCKYFPFNRYLVSDDVLIVLPRFNLCPLHLCADETDCVVVRHAELLEELRVEWSTVVGTAEYRRTKAEETQNKNGQKSKSRRWTREIVEFEAYLRDFAVRAEYGDNLELWSAQAAASEGFPATGAPDPALQEGSKKSLLVLTGRVAQYFGFSARGENGLFGNTRLRTLTSLIRLDLLRLLDFLPFDGVVELAAPTLVGLSLFANEAEQLAGGRPLSLQETTALCQSYLVPSLLSQFLDWEPWLDDEYSATLELPQRSRLTTAFIECINPNARSLTLAQALEAAGAHDVEARLDVLNELAWVLPWLRFSPPDSLDA